MSLFILSLSFLSWIRRSNCIRLAAIFKSGKEEQPEDHVRAMPQRFTLALVIRQVKKEKLIFTALLQYKIQIVLLNCPSYTYRFAVAFGISKRMGVTSRFRCPFSHNCGIKGRIPTDAAFPQPLKHCGRPSLLRPSAIGRKLAFWISHSFQSHKKSLKLWFC